MAEAATNVLVAALNFINGTCGWTGKLMKNSNRVSSKGADFENAMFGLLTPIGAKFEEVFLISTDDSPPEGLILGGGPALEKKHDKIGASKTPLNSSDPNAWLRHDDPRLSSLIRNSGDWSANGIREIIYTVGNQEMKNKKGGRDRGSGIIIMAYGDLLTGGDFRARKEWERRQREHMERDAIELGLPYSLDTNELFCLKDTDGMGAQQRIRRMQSMWNPLKRFKFILSQDPEFARPVPLWFGLLRSETYDALPQASKDALQPHIATSDFVVRDAETEIVVVDPNQTADFRARVRKTVRIKVLRARQKSLAPA
jgi:hypothetical protein